MVLDFVLASLHHLAVFSLFGILIAELLLLRSGFEGTALARISRLDLAYGIVAGLVVVFGFLRVFFGAKPPNFYLTSLIFWTKIALFVFIGFLSIGPTLRFIDWRRQVRRDSDWRPPTADVRRLRVIVHVEAGLFLLLPILAAAMARGLG
ncbi:DUF2214 family protein [Beijerinckia indica]|uniref:Transmembrane protein n=1 Tax=Beijerinckia indica subsp. indica (strain ATCC 9039 / DSM 1715 / NCIMB 8712) TaxID=395963 RepID=B2IJL3_BEII9|nr:DUF2214 family protein [Beijerinckia indica]ACB94885.1 conserved hypothetical protein [Beijerinckia indica subsp. indica ATCC 9039]